MFINTLLSKFAAVEVNNETRISEEDRAYCQAQQELYVAVLNQYRKTYRGLMAIKRSEADFFESVSAKNTYSDKRHSHPIYGREFLSIDSEALVDAVKTTVHARFIEQIMNYFRNKYSIQVESPEFSIVSGLEKPKYPDSPHFGYRDLTEAEKQERNDGVIYYKQVFETYFESVLSTELSYTSIIDRIFVELGGCTFAERAEQEIIEGSQNAVWGRYGNPYYEVKNKRISFTYLTHVRKEAWVTEYRVSLSSSGYLAILRALTYFDSDKACSDIYDSWEKCYVDYSKDESLGIFDVHEVGGHDTSKVLTFKYMKNGKFEVGFRSAADAQAFADTYLGPKPNFEN